LGNKTLPVAVREYVEEWSRQNKVEPEVRIYSNISLDSQKEQALFRILQEALANVARHSKADKVWVALEADGDQIQLGIEDNGIGVEMDRVIKGIGLNSMQERIQAVQGTLQISSRKPQGTCVVARVRRS
jgi:NarL family two-component system sensor histidine kinase LiaS